MVIKYKLENGLTVLLEPISSVVSISAGLWVKIGSRNEKPNQSGYAHFLEHMLFKGTEKYSAKEIAQIVDRVGGQHNAITNREYTCYYINVISDYIESSLDLLSEMYYKSLFDQEDIEKEKNVILEEIGMYEDTPDEIVHDIFMEAMLSGHPLGSPILGTTESILAINRNKITGFFNDNYKNENCIFALAGNFDVDKAKLLIDKYFNGKDRTDQNPKQPECAEPVRIYHNHVERDLEQIHFCLGTEGLKKNDKDRWALYTLSTILGGSVSSRLFQNIREKEGLCYSIYSFHSSYSDNGIFGIYCGTSPEKYKRVLNLILDECKLLVKDGITEQELNDIKAYIKGNLALSLESTEVKMGQLARNEITYGRTFSFDEIVNEIESVTLYDFNRVCQKILSQKRLTVVSIGKLDDENNEDLNLYI
ncbi:MAG: insulinase family protein [Spirochaetes bacterium]|nr:insulinase family protein [Spirochaetota bacterium]